MSFLPAAARATPLLNTIARSNRGSALQFYRCIRKSAYPPPRGLKNPKFKTPQPEAPSTRTLGPWAQRDREGSRASKSPNRPERRGGPPERDSRRETSKFERPERRSRETSRPSREPRGSSLRFDDRKPFSKERSFDRDSRNRSFDRDSRARSSDRDFSSKGRSFDKRESGDRDFSSKNRSSEKREPQDREYSSKSRSFDKRESRDRDFQPYDRRDKDPRPSKRNDRGPALDRPPRAARDRHERSVAEELEDDNSSSSMQKYTPLPTAEDSPFVYPEEFESERRWPPRREIIREHPDSEFIYGTSVVEAALRSGRRDLYKLYIYAGAGRQPESLLRDAQMKKLAKAARVRVVDEYDVGLLDSMANSRPHNGYVLECSSLLKTPILSLLSVTKPGDAITLQIAQHDNTQPDIRLSEVSPSINTTESDRYPLILMLDSILDPGNLGAIIRSAYYLGASAVMFSSTHSAPLSPVALKSSAGAAEFMPILTYKNPVRLVEASIENGWQFYAAVAPHAPAAPGDGPRKEPRREKAARLESMEIKQALMNKPTVVVMGAEGAGLNVPLRRACDKAVTITQLRGSEIGLDSLNVSVAAAVLCQGFLARHFGKNLKDEDKLF